MKVIYSTVGRRDESDRLRPLNAEELAQKDQPLINIPLECGFDLEKSSRELTPIDQLRGLKLSEWTKPKLDFEQVAESRRQGRESFRGRVIRYLNELEPQIPQGANVLFAHTMAGGVPRAKIILPVMNRVFKGHGDRYASSQEFWSGPLGQLCAQSFMDVTAGSLADLIELSQNLRERISKWGGQCSYVATVITALRFSLMANTAGRVTHPICRALPNWNWSKSRCAPAVTGLPHVSLTHPKS